MNREDQLRAMRAVHRLERDKRKAAIESETAVATEVVDRYRSDPNAAPSARAAVHDEVDAVVVGAGIGGLLSAVELHRAGLERVRLIDTAGDVGGVWYWNRYPGVRCDIESYIYMPMLEEVNYIPTEKYASGPEIFEHLRRITSHFQLYDLALFQTAVTAAKWDEERNVWTISTDRGDEITAKFLVISNGVLNRLRLPGVPGIDRYSGKASHTSRWDYTYTGGDWGGNLTGLADKTVGVIGTGATGIQCIPIVAEYAKHLYVFQRTPSTVAARNNQPTDPAWAAKLTPGWQARRAANFERITCGLPEDVDYVSDGWTDLYKDLLSVPEGLDADATAHARDLADLAKMESIRSRIDSTVHDPQVAAALKPYYKYLCKRPCFHDAYLDTFNRSNVTLVDTEGAGVEGAYEGGLLANGTKYPLDCVIFATGFDWVMTGTFTDKLGFDPVGRSGHTLGRKWQGGLITLHGITTADFPNMFVMPALFSQSTVTHNFVHTIEENAKHIGYLVSETRRLGKSVIEVTPEAENGWVETIIRCAPNDRQFREECTPSRFNNFGKVAERPSQNTNYGVGPIAMFEVLSEWRRSGKLPGMRLS